ncbi:SRPBCC family protein [Zhongshania arctica]|uniref:SRPBCC family protein n=1 Tax=Zhongshania arctica TaxID=3238302 RepID=A0ABV3U1K3_9GAMM
MKSVHIAVHRQIACPVGDVFELLKDSEAMGKAAGMPMTLIVEGEDRDGPGAVRRVGPPVVGVEETIIEVIPNELIRYRISRNGGPIKNYEAQMRVEAKNGGTELSWIMDFEVPWALSGPLRMTLPKVAGFALKRLGKQLESGQAVPSAS